MLDEIFKEISSPEYKAKMVKEYQEQFDNLNMDYQLGYFVGRHIVHSYLPTLSTDMLYSGNVIEVSEEDKIENKRLDQEWLKTTRHNDDWNGEDDGDKEKWNLYFQHNKMLEKKYLPNPLECHLELIKFNDEVEFKEGLRWALWDCDMCSYNIEPENIKIVNEMEYGWTKISFQYNPNSDVEVE